MPESNSISLPPRVKDQRGKKFNRLTVLEFAGLVTKCDGRRESQWLCRCDCGTEKVVKLTNLLASQVQSCGCLKIETTSKRHRTHGMSNSRVYEIWTGMIKRCHNPRNQAYDRYGGRGITVCERWRNSFQAFFDDMGEPPTNKHTLERKQNDLGYSPDNCKWATYKEQGRNTRRNIMVTYRGETKSLPDWCDELELPYSGIKMRLSKGMSAEEALTKPMRTPTTLTVDGETLTLSEWASRTGVRMACIHKRMKKGWSPERCISP